MDNNDEKLHRRLDFLPCYPSKSLLLSNVPQSILSHQQLADRQSGVFPTAFQLIERKEQSISIIPSFMKYLHRNLIVEWSQQWNIDASIIDYNFTRLDEITTQFQIQPYHLHEWPLALEIFLQIDGQ